MYFFRIIRPRLLIYVFQERNIQCGMWITMMFLTVSHLERLLYIGPIAALGQYLYCMCVYIYIYII